MKAIILAAGKGTRLRPITNDTPKPLISICGKTILEHNLEHIYDAVDEIIIVVKYLSDKIKSHLGYNYQGTKITYYEQGEKKGTGAAIMGIDIEKGDVLILNGDSIFTKKDLEKIIKLNGYGTLVQEVEEPKKYGIFEKKSNGTAKRIVEKPQNNIGNLANLGVYKFSYEIFEIAQNITLSPREEYEITDAINIFIEKHTFQLLPIDDEFIDIGYPWNILDANTYFLNRLTDSKIEGIIEEGVTIKGKIILEKGAILKSGTYIEGNVFIGENSSIGPNTYIRGNTCIGQNCKIGNAVEIKNSSIGHHTNVAHLSYIGDSILGNNINIGGGFITANLRHDNANIKVPVKGVFTDTGKRKLGTIIGDGVKTGINVSIMPGRVIESGSMILPGEMIKK